MAETIIAAVLTGDVIGSSKFSPVKRKKLLSIMRDAMEKARLLLPDFKPEIFQGDSFQGYTIKSPGQSLRTALYIIMSMQSQRFGIRISTGLGNISFQTGESLTSDGTAFQYSGRNMEILKKKDLVLAIGTDNEALQGEWEVHTATINFLLKRCTPLQAAALIEMLEKKTQQEAAANLKVKQPAIHQRLQAAGWPLLQNIIARFESQF